MSHDVRKRLKAERAQLSRLIAGTEAGAESLTLRSLGLRLAEISEELQNVPALEYEPASVTLTFRGQPVVGAYGIFAQFASLALNSFTNAVSAVGASMRRGLKPGGRLPDRTLYRFIVVGVVRGSFGFELEEAPANDQHPLDLELPTRASEALERTMEILHASKSQDEDAVSEAIVDLDQRAVTAVRLFVKRLETSQAHGSLVSANHEIVFRSLSEVRAARAILDKSNVTTQQEVLTGTFLGVLPQQRRFEFEDDDRGLIRGGIDKSVDDPIRFNLGANTRAEITVSVTKVGSSAGRYVLIDEPRFAE